MQMSWLQELKVKADQKACIKKKWRNEPIPRCGKAIQFNNKQPGSANTAKGVGEDIYNEKEH